jgi:hypothetical protein
MKLAIHPTPKTTLEVEAIATNHPELAIHPLQDHGWAVTHIPSGELVLYGLMSEDLAVAAANMITASGMKLGPGHTKPHLLTSYRAFVGWRENNFFRTMRGRLAVA